MKNYFEKWIFLAFLSVILSGCKKFLDISTPPTELLTNAVFSDNSTANGAMVSIYSKMANDGYNEGVYGMSLFTSLLSDELKSHTTDQDLRKLFENNLTSQNIFPTYIWEGAYARIYQANEILENLVVSEKVDASLKQQLRGEALFIRAFWHFYLTNLFGSIPIVTTTDYRMNSRNFRQSKDKVYEQILLDLQMAFTFINANYVGADGISISEERVRPNRFVVSAFLARVYLYLNDFSNAERCATSVVEYTKEYRLENDISKVFLKNSSEAIWQLQPGGNGINTIEGYSYILENSPESGVERSSSLSDAFMNSFEPNDKRKSNWVGSILVDNETFYFPFKYKVASGFELVEYSMVFRLAEQYLIRAEARAKLNKLDEARADINAIRIRAGLPQILTGTQQNLIDAAHKERRFELFTEWGDRWFDLKRNGKINEVMVTTSVNKGGAWITYDQLLPIPLNDIKVNSNLTQNEGY